jgi:L-fuculose-phosphate aldolase
MDEILVNAANEVSSFMQRIYRRKLTTCLGGNVSVRINDTILITPSQIDKDKLTSEDIICLNLEGNIIHAPQTASMETQMHLAVYKNRKDIHAIIHAHAFWGTLLAVSDLKLQKDISDEAYFMLPKIAYTNYQTMGSIDLANEVGDKIQDADMLIIKNHGILSVGTDLAQALERIEVLENLVHYAYLANPAIKLIPLSEEAKENMDERFRKQD